MPHQTIVSDGAKITRYLVIWTLFVIFDLLGLNKQMINV